MTKMAPRNAPTLPASPERKTSSQANRRSKTNDAEATLGAMSESTVQAKRKIGPGSGRRKAVPHLKGRQVEPKALGEIRTLLGERPRDRDSKCSDYQRKQQRNWLVGKITAITIGNASVAT